MIVGRFKEQTLAFMSPQIQIPDGTGTQISTLHLLFLSVQANCMPRHNIIFCCRYVLKSAHTGDCLFHRVSYSIALLEVNMQFISKKVASHIITTSDDSK